jgi:hypothetical protein
MARSSSSAQCMFTTSASRPVQRLAVLGGFLLAEAPVLRELGVAARQAGAERQEADAVLARGQHAGGGGGGGDGDREARVGVGREVQAGFAQLEPVGLHRDRLVAGEQAGDGVERLVHHRPLLLGLDAHHVGVGHQRAGAAAQHGAAARHVVELHEALRHQEGVVVGQAGDAGAEHDVLGALGRAAMKISGLAISSQPAEWCSPIQASS